MSDTLDPALLDRARKVSLEAWNVCQSDQDDPEQYICTEEKDCDFHAALIYEIVRALEEHGHEAYRRGRAEGERTGGVDSETFAAVKHEMFVTRDERDRAREALAAAERDLAVKQDMLNSMYGNATAATRRAEAAEQREKRLRDRMTSMAHFYHEQEYEIRPDKWEDCGSPTCRANQVALAGEEK